MTATNIPSTDELDELAKQFKSWRRENPGKYIPRNYWVRAVRLTKRFPVNTVAKRVGADAFYLRSKLRREDSTMKSAVAKAEDLQFAEVPSNTAKYVLGFNQPITMRVKNPKGLQIDLAFTSGISELIPFIKELICEG